MLEELEYNRCDWLQKTCSELIYITFNVYCKMIVEPELDNNVQKKN